MSITKLSIRSLLLALTIAALPLRAQTADLENWYQVEVIVFAQQDDFGDEARPLDPLLSYPRKLQFLRTTEQLSPQLPPAASYNEILAALMVPEKFSTRERAKQISGFVPLESSQRNLNPDAYTLRRGREFRVLFHSAWQQPVQGARSSPWVLIQGGNQSQGHRELEGSLKVYKSRFMHVALDLWLTPLDIPQSAPTVEGENLDQPPGIALPEPPTLPMSKALQRLQMIDTLKAPLGDGAPPLATTAEPEMRVLTVDTMNFSQRISLNSLTYIDHPRMGALVLITALKSDDESEDSEN